MWGDCQVNELDLDALLEEADYGGLASLPMDTLRALIRRLREAEAYLAPRERRHLGRIDQLERVREAATRVEGYGWGINKLPVGLAVAIADLRAALAAADEKP